MKIEKRSVLYSAGLLSLSAVALQLMGFLYRILLGRMVGAAGMGMYQMVMSAYSVLQSISLSGLAVAVSRLTAEHTARGDHSGATWIVRNARRLFFIFFMAAAVVFVSLSGWVAEGLFGEPSVRLSLLLLLPCLFLTGFENLGKASFHGMRRVVPPIVSELGEQVIRITTVAALLIFLPWSTPAEAVALIVIGMVVSEVFSSTFLSVWLGRVLPPAPPPAPGRFLQVMAVAAPLMLSGVSATFMTALNTMLIPGRLSLSGLGEEALAVFGLFSGMLQPLVMLPSALLFPLTTTLVPRLAGYSALGNQASLRRKAAKAIHLVGLVGFPASAILITLGPQCAKAMFGSVSEALFTKYVFTRTFVMLSVGACALFYQVICGSVLHGTGHQRRAAAAVILTGVFELVFTWFIVPLPGLGAMMVPLEFLLSSLIGCFMNMSAVIRQVGLNVRFRNWFVAPALAAAVCGITAHQLFPVLSRLNLSETPALLLTILASAGAYGLALWFQGMHPLSYFRGLLVEESPKNAETV